VGLKRVAAREGVQQEKECVGDSGGSNQTTHSVEALAN